MCYQCPWKTLFNRYNNSVVELDVFLMQVTGVVDVDGNDIHEHDIMAGPMFIPQEVSSQVRTNFDQKVGNYFVFLAAIVLICAEQESKRMRIYFKLRKVRTNRDETSWGDKHGSYYGPWNVQC